MKAFLGYGIHKYLADIIEMALVAEERGNAFHSYIRIHYSIPKRVKELTNITDRTLAAISCVAHGGYLHDFLIILTNCMKYNFNDFGNLKDCLFMDSVHIFKDDGYQRPGLDTLCQKLNVKRNIHSVLRRCFYTKEVIY